MINLIILLIFASIVVVSIYNLALGYSLIVATIFLIPRVALMSSAVSVISKISLVMMLMLVIIHLKEKKKYHSLPRALKNPFLLYFASCLFLFIFSFTVPKGLQLRGYINELTFVTFAFSGYLVFKEIKQINLFIYTIIVTTILVSAYAVFTYYTKVNIYLSLIDIYYGNKNEFKVDGLDMVRGFVGSRLQSTFDHPLTLGQIFVLVFAFLALFKRKLGIFFYLLTPLIVLIIFLTGSRSAIVSLLPCFAIFFFLINWKTKLVLSLFLFALIPALENNFFQLSPQVNRSIKASIIFWDNDLQQQAEYNGSSVEMRLDQLEAVVEKLSKTNPLTGFGLGYREYNQTRIGGLDKDLLGYESVFFLKPVEQGLIGMFFLFYLLFKMYTTFPKKPTYLSIQERFYLQAYFLSYILGITMTGMRFSSFLMFVIFYMVFRRFIQIRATNAQNQFSNLT